MFQKAVRPVMAALSAVAVVCAAAVCGFGVSFAEDTDARGEVPDYCGDKSVVMLTDSGEVYQVHIPDMDLPVTGNIADNGGTINARCMVPLPYLPANITIRTGLSPSDPNRFTRRPMTSTGGDGTQRTYDALASNRDDGTLWAALMTGPRAKPEMQVYRLTKEARESHASRPNPAYTKVGLSDSYWTPVGSKISGDELGGAYPTGGAVDRTDGLYYVAAVKPSQCAANKSSRATADCSKYSATTRVLRNWDIDFYTTSGGRPVKTGTLSLTDGEYAPGSRSSDIEFDDTGNLTLILSWYETGRMRTRHVRRLHIPAANVRNGSFMPDSDVMVDTNTSLPVNLTLNGYTNLSVSGIGSSSPSSEDMTVSLLDSYGLSGQSLYSLASDGTMERVFTFPSNPPYTLEADQEGRLTSQRLLDENLWGGGSTAVTTAPHSYSFYSGDITDIADGIGAVERPQPYYGGYQFKKVTESGAALPDVQFMLWPRPGNGSCDTVPSGSADGLHLGSDGSVTGRMTATSGADGSVQFPDLPLGQAKKGDTKTPMWFCVAETRTPDNYMAHEPWSVQVEPGAVTDGAPIVNRRATGTVTVVKHDRTTGGVLAGAQFELVEDTDGDGRADAGEPRSPSDGQTVKTTPADGTLIWRDVPLGKTYIVHEAKAPEGYMTVTEHDPSRDEQSVTLTMANRNATVYVNDVRETGELSWGKYAEGAVPSTLTADNALGGAEWTLTYVPDAGNPTQGWTKTVSDCSQAGCGPGTDITMLPDMNPAAGLFTVRGLEWGTYTLKERKAPLGYVLSDRTYTFTIGASDLKPAPVLISNTQASGPRLPAAGGTSADLYKWVASGLFGCALLGGIVALIRKRRTLHH